MVNAKIKILSAPYYSDLENEIQAFDKQIKEQK